MFRDERYLSNNTEVAIPAHLNYGKYILDRIRKQPRDNIALINGKTDAKLTYGELTQYAVDLAVSLLGLGVGRDSVVVVCTESCNEFIPIVLGVLLTGATYTPLDLKVGRANLRQKIYLTKPQHIICSQSFWDKYRDILENFKFKNVISINDDSTETMIPIKTLIQKNYNVNQFEPAIVKGQKDVALILYSSGSTGIPKGIMMTHLTCINNCLIGSFADDSLKTSICYGEWCHSYDNHTTFKFLAAGRTVVYFYGDSTVFLKCIQQHQVNVAFTYPSIIYELAERDDLEQYNLNSLQFVYCGTSALDVHTRNKFIKRLPNLEKFVQGYGMTETFEITSEWWGVPGLKPKSVGKPVPRITLKVVDLITQKPLGANERGELCVDVHNIFKGYIGIDPSTHLDGEGFLRTGDLAYYDEDGYVYIIDRLKEIISYDGYKVSPVEIEMLLLQYPGVKDAGVAGRPVPDYGELPTALVVKEPDSNITEKDLIDFIDYEAAPHMKLRGGVKFADEIPRNSLGKIIRPELKKLINRQ